MGCHPHIGLKNKIKSNQKMRNFESIRTPIRTCSMILHFLNSHFGLSCYLDKIWIKGHGHKNNDGISIFWVTEMTKVSSSKWENKLELLNHLSYRGLSFIFLSKFNLKRTLTSTTFRFVR